MGVLRVSRRIVQSVVAQGQCNTEKSRKQTAVFHVHPACSSASVSTAAPDGSLKILREGAELKDKLPALGLAAHRP